MGTSSKYGAASVTREYRNPGDYRCYTFGVIDASAAFYDVPHAEDHSILENPEPLLVNILTITRMGADAPTLAHFDFYTFR